MIKDFYEAWWYLVDHPYFQHPVFGGIMTAFPASIYIEVVKVNPENLTIERDEDKNTLTQVWLECGGWIEHDHKYEMCHDPDLDSGGDTFEDAVIELANILQRK